MACDHQRPTVDTTGRVRRAIRIVIADDQVMVRKGLRAVLDSEPDMEVVGDADDGLQAVELARQFHPDVVVMDVAMGKNGGIDATRRIKVEIPDTTIIALSVLADNWTVSTMLGAGAAAYLSKNDAFDELAKTIREVLAERRQRSPGDNPVEN